MRYAVTSRSRNLRFRAQQLRNACMSSSIERWRRERTLVGGLGSHFGDVSVLSVSVEVEEQKVRPGGANVGVSRLRVDRAR
jgi:hypothetical protein